MEYDYEAHRAVVADELAELGIPESELEGRAGRLLSAEDREFVKAVRKVYSQYGPEAVELAVKRYYVYRIAMQGWNDGE